MITPENLILVLAGALAVWVLARLFGQPRPTPAYAPPPVVTARVVEPHPVPPDTVQLLGQLHQMIEAKGIALAFDRKATEMIEARSKSVVLPWAASSPAPPPDPPQA